MRCITAGGGFLLASVPAYSSLMYSQQIQKKLVIKVRQQHAVAIPIHDSTRSEGTTLDILHEVFMVLWNTHGKCSTLTIFFSTSQLCTRLALHMRRESRMGNHLLGASQVWLRDMV